MKMDKNSVMERTREVARAFIAGHFDNESYLFDVFWDVFSSRWDFGKTESSGICSSQKTIAAIREVSFANDNAVDLVTPVIVATVAETALKLNGKDLSLAKIKKVVANAVAHCEAGVELAACLVRYLPTMWEEALATKKDSEEAVGQIVDGIPVEKLWVEHCDSVGKPHEIPSPSTGWYNIEEVDSRFRRGHEKYELFIDERAPAIYLAKEDESVPWAKLQARHKKLLGVILEALPKQHPITLKGVFNRSLPENHERKFNRYYDGARIRSDLSELNRILGGLFKNIIKAERGMEQYAFVGQITYCWIRSGNRSTRLLPSSP